MRVSCRSIVAFALAACVCASVPAYAQKLITQAKVTAGNFTPGDTPGFPLTISVRGSYKLTSNLVVPSTNTIGVHITADNVTLDLNGFGIFGPGGVAAVNAGHGIYAVQSNITISNGSVRGVGGVGIWLAGNSHRVENVYVTSAGWAGLDVGNNSIVRGSTVILSSSAQFSVVAVRVGPGSVFTNNVVNSNYAQGIYALHGTILMGNTVRGNSGTGMDLVDAVYSNNVISGNLGTVNGGIQMGPNICNSAPCP
jgi:parallel beta helix pectate lyase-like protein